MEALMLGLLLLAAVLLSSIIDQLVPRISLPLIQIALGLVIALFAPGGITITLDPELFLVLFIAPLLYNEAKNADRPALLRFIKPVLSLAIGLVVATALIIGFALHWVVPSIPLAAAFALGAALGPTDAVAVTSLSSVVAIPDRQKNILRGELLINDASGIVSFQFAIAAVITGTFSLLSATVDFLIEFFGGLLFGAVLGAFANFLLRQMRSIGVENTTFHVLFEVFTPFLVFLISDAFHVSGIIAVVVAGLLNVISPRTSSPAISRMNIVSSSVWRVLTFALNGIVFVLLGTQLPKAMRRTWDDVTIGNEVLIGLVIGLTAVLLLVRLAWVLVMDLIHVHQGEHRRYGLRDFKLTLATTLCGAKGTITLSILFTIPLFINVDGAVINFPQRDLIIFLACGVILLTLLLATFIVPLLVPRPSRKESEQAQHIRDAEAAMAIFREVIEQLTARMTPENRRETQAVIRSYSERLAGVKDDNDFEDEPNVELRLEALSWEQERTIELMDAKETPPLVGYRYLARLERIKRLLRHGKNVHWWNGFGLRVRALLRRGVNRVLRELPTMSLPTTVEAFRDLQRRTCAFVIERLEEAIGEDRFPTEDATGLLLEYQRMRRALLVSRPTLTGALRAADQTEVRRYALSLELELIQEMYDDERLSRAAARRMRDNVYLMQLDLEDNL